MGVQRWQLITAEGRTVQSTAAWLCAVKVKGGGSELGTTVHTYRDDTQCRPEAEAAHLTIITT